MQGRPGTSSGVRPGTSSGGRPGTSSGRVVVGGQLAPPPRTEGGFIVRVRSAQATLRCVFDTHDSTIGDLRVELARLSGLAVERQVLSATRRPWFDGPPGPPLDSFPDPTSTLRAAGLKHGDMIFVEALPAIDVNVDVVEPVDSESAPTADETTLEQDPILAFRGLDLADEADQRAAASHRAALQIIASMREEAVAVATADPSSASSSSNNLSNLAELQRLVEQAARATDWTMAMSGAGAASTLVDDADRSARSDSQRAGADSRASSRADDLDDPRPSHSRSHSQSLSRAGSAGLCRTAAAAAAAEDPSSIDSVAHAASSDSAVAAAAAAAAAASLAELTRDLAYWRGRYDRLRVKAEKMNAAGMSLKNQHDLALLTHEKETLLARARLRRRDERIAQLERVVSAWEQHDRQRGGDGIVHVEPMPSEMTSLANAPRPGSSRSRRPAPPTAAAAADDATQIDPPKPVRRARPESASRYRGRSVSDAATPPAVAAVPPAQPPQEETRPVRPQSAGRSRSRVAASGAAIEPETQPDAFAVDDTLRSARGLVDGVDGESRTFRAAQAAAVVGASRDAVRDAIDASRIGRAQMAAAAAASRHGPVLATPHGQTRYARA